MAVEFAILNNRRGGGIAVKLVHPLRIFLPQNFNIMQQLAGMLVDTDGVQPHQGKNDQRLAAGVFLEALLFLRLGFLYQLIPRILIMALISIILIITLQQI